MFTRLFIIALFLALPIVIALLSQRMADTVAPPALPAAPLEIRLSEGDARRPGTPGKPPAAEDAPVITPRVIQRAPTSGSTEAGPAARPSGAPAGRNGDTPVPAGGES